MLKQISEKHGRISMISYDNIRDHLSHMDTRDWVIGIRHMKSNDKFLAVSIDCFGLIQWKLVSHWQDAIKDAKNKISKSNKINRFRCENIFPDYIRNWELFGYAVKTCFPGDTIGLAIERYNRMIGVENHLPNLRVTKDYPNKFQTVTMNTISSKMFVVHVNDRMTFVDVNIHKTPFVWDSKSISNMRCETIFDISLPSVFFLHSKEKRKELLETRYSEILTNGRSALYARFRETKPQKAQFRNSDFFKMDIRSIELHEDDCTATVSLIPNERFNLLKER